VPSTTCPNSYTGSATKTEGNGWVSFLDPKELPTTNILKTTMVKFITFAHFMSILFVGEYLFFAVCFVIYFCTVPGINT
jgi:hypothetical protein